MKYLILILLSISLLSACNGDDNRHEQRAQLNNYSQLWHNRSLSDYEFTYILQCFCAEVREMVVTVEDNQVVSAFYTDDGEYVSEQTLGNLHTVDELFDLIARLIDGRPYHLEITYNSTYGYPEIISVNHSRDIADSGATYRVWDLR